MTTEITVSLKLARGHHEQSIKMKNFYVEVLLILKLVVNKQKTDYIVFSTRKRSTNTVLNVENEKIAESNYVKYRGAIIDSKLQFEKEAKRILPRIACGIKVLNTLSKKLPEKTKILLHNALVINYLNFSA